MQLPNNYTPISDVLDLQTARNGLLKEIKPLSMVSVVGLITDRREPCSTRNQDWKATVRLVDLSTESGDTTIEVHMFYPEDVLKAMPKASCGDVLILHSVKVQSRNGDVSLMTNKYQTKFCLYKASKIPKPPGNAAGALVSFPAQYQKPLDPRDAQYAAYLRATISESSVPQEEEFIRMNVQSANVKEKARELKDVTHESFCDLTVQVVRPPFDGGSATILWVTDYTTNPAFYNFQDPGLQSDSPKETCPRGQISMQISCFDEHITHIQEAGITKGTWVFIRNVRIRYGHLNNNLEGFLRGFQGDVRDAGKPIKISVLRAEDKDDLTPRHKAALERYRDYLRAEKAKHQAVEDAAAVGRKRKASAGTGEGNSKSKRRARRQAEKARKSQLEEAPAIQQPRSPPNEVAKQAAPSAPNLNPSIKCEKLPTPPRTVAFVTQIHQSMFDIGDGKVESLTLPFVNRKYRMDVRVLDFYPPNLEDFAHRKRIKPQNNGLELLSNDGGSVFSSSDDGSDVEATDLWEWRFWLLLEDASPDVQRQSFWVLVDNPSAQCLTSLDAENLRENKPQLDRLREHMFIVWGDLEDRKRTIEAAQARAETRRSRDAPPAHSDDEDEGDLSRVSNRPFPCCVEQYGVRMRESDPEKANAGEGRRWQRVFKLFGVRIA